MRYPTELRIYSKNPIVVAREYKRQIAKMQAKIDKLYYKALRTLGVSDGCDSWVYFRHDQQGFSSFEERLTGVTKADLIAPDASDYDLGGPDRDRQFGGGK
jgi:hypothetical protein